MDEGVALTKYSKTKYETVCLYVLNRKNKYRNERKVKTWLPPNLCSQAFVTVTGVKLVSQMPMMKRVKCNEFYLTH